MLTIDQIQSAVATYYGISVEQLTSPDRSALDTTRRAVAYRLCNELLTDCHSAIAQQFGGRDHTCVIRALKRPLAFDSQVAFEMIKTDLIAETNHNDLVKRRWPFKSRRKAPTPVFLRRYTA